MAEQHGKNVNGPDDGLPPYAPYPSYNPVPPGEYPSNPMPPAGPPQYPGWTPPPPAPPPVSVTVQSGGYPNTTPLGTTTTIIAGGVLVGPGPTRIVCRSCNQEIVTRIDRRPSMKTHLIAILLCVVGCWPCAPMPYCVDSCLNAEHYCSNCGAFVGTYNS